MVKRHRYESLNLENKSTYLFGRFCDGLRAIPGNFAKTFLVLLYWTITLVLISHVMSPTTDILGKLLQPVICVLVLTCSIMLFLACVTASAIPPGTYRFANAFLRIKVTNAAGEPPLLTRCWKEGEKTIVEFFTQGLSIPELQEHVEMIESALNMRIIKITEGHNKQHILLHLAPGNAKLPEKIYLPILKEHLPKILVGESLDGPVVIDLNKQPHFLVAGSTGSGKTTLIKSIIMQLLERDNNKNSICDVFLIDLKGGLDYPPSWRGQLCSFSSNSEDALSLLSYVVQELEQRKILFAMVSEQHGKSCSSLEDYNRIVEDNKLRRIAVVIDEIAELTDSTGMGKEYKDLAKAIVSQLSTLARLGRAFGINLFLGTQRPDVNAIPGQIKNNLDVRLCGKADQTLSMIILDNTSAADLIPKDSQGLFLNQDGVLFRGYLLN